LPKHTLGALIKLLRLSLIMLQCWWGGLRLMGGLPLPLCGGRVQHI